MHVRGRNDVDLPHDLDARDVEVWRDVDGAVAAVGFRTDEVHNLYVPRIGTFALAARSDQIRLTPEGSPPAALIEDAFQRIAIPLALQLAGRQALHASAVVHNGVVALCGRAGTGKSTIAYGLGQHECPLWADDTVAFEVSGPVVKASPLPFRMRLRPTSAKWFGDLAHEKGSELAAPWRLGSEEVLPFRALFVLERLAESTSSPPVQIVRLAPADAFVQVLPHAYFLTLDDEALNRRLLHAYLTLSDHVPVFALRFVPRLSLVDRIADRVKSAVMQL